MNAFDTIRPLSAESDPRWAAVASRDPAADGAFVFAVTTTGIYCRPTCPARRPRPEHARLFDTPAQAREAGFRACRRCKPDQPGPSETAARITAACRAIEQAESAPTLGELADAAGLSPYHFHRLFKQHTGLTPRQYAAAHRHSRVREALASGASVTDAIYEAGYGSNSRFYETAPDVLGMEPARYRAGGAEASIRYATARCSLGWVLAAQSERGLCAILLGDDPAKLAEDLRERFPRARLEEAGDKTPGDFGETLARVVALVEQPRSGLALPLDVRGTAFQQRVWQALRQIPAGQTATYTQIAERIGAPKSARAVAQACAANALAVAIPCHRVVRRGGELSGYRWGVERKRALLKKEAEAGG